MDIATIPQFIELNPEIRFVKPILRGTRTTVAEVLGMLANGISAAEIQDDFPAISEAHVRACLPACLPACSTRPIRKASCCWLQLSIVCGCC